MHICYAYILCIYVMTGYLGVPVGLLTVRETGTVSDSFACLWHLSPPLGCLCDGMCLAYCWLTACHVSLGWLRGGRRRGSSEGEGKGRGRFRRSEGGEECHGDEIYGRGKGIRSSIHI